MALGRRAAGLGLGVSMVSMATSTLYAPPAAASKLPAFADSAWEAVTGAGADLYFPEPFLGTWDVESTLVKVDTPLGESAVPDLRVVERARQQDLGRTLRYRACFVRNRSGRPIFDRRFNTASLMAAYNPGSSVDFAGRIEWDADDPNVLRLEMPGGGLVVRTRVTRRSEADSGPQRLETSEYLEQVFEGGGESGGAEGGSPRVKASQCFTKYLWREAAAAEQDGGPQIIATQVVSDFLTPYDGEREYIQAMNRPVATYTYRLAFRRHHDSGEQSILLEHS